MQLGRERGILRWDIHASLLSTRLAQLEAELAALAARIRPGEPSERLDALIRERDDAQRALAALGPSPRAKMG